MEACELLKDAKALIEDPDHWTRGAYFAKRDARSAPVDILEGECFCAMGALYRVAVEKDPTKVKSWTQMEYRDTSAFVPAVREALTALEDVVPSEHSITSFNDSADTRHPDVMKLYDEAIARICK